MTPEREAEIRRMHFDPLNPVLSIAAELALLDLLDEIDKLREERVLLEAAGKKAVDVMEETECGQISGYESHAKDCLYCADRYTAINALRVALEEKP